MSEGKKGGISLRMVMICTIVGLLALGAVGQMFVVSPGGTTVSSTTGRTPGGSPTPTPTPKPSVANVAIMTTVGYDGAGAGAKVINLYAGSIRWADFDRPDVLQDEVRIPTCWDTVCERPYAYVDYSQLKSAQGGLLPQMPKTLSQQQEEQAKTFRGFLDIGFWTMGMVMWAFLWFLGPARVRSALVITAVSVILGLIIPITGSDVWLARVAVFGTALAMPYYVWVFVRNQRWNDPSRPDPAEVHASFDVEHAEVTSILGQQESKRWAEAQQSES